MTRMIAAKYMFRMTTASMVSLVSVLTCMPSWGQEAPRKVLERFCQMDAQGMQLTDLGLREISLLFTHARESRAKRSIVVRDFVVSPALIEGSKAKLYVEYIYLGQLDESGPRFSPLPQPFPREPIKVRIDYDLVLTDEYWQTGRDGGTATKVRGPAAWRIEGPEPEPHITVDTAIHYLTGIRSTALDERTRKNADRAIASLKLQQ